MSRIGQIQREWSALADEQSRLIAERDALFALAWPQAAPVRGAAPAPTPAPATELQLSTVRNALLAVGAVLVALAAVIFTGYAWSRLGPSGRATMLVGITLVSGGIAAGIRRRLPATAETFAALTIGLVLVDWLAAAVALGIADDRLALWWAAGTAVAALVGAVGVAAFKSARLAVPMLGMASGVLFVVAGTDAPWLIACGFAAVALAAVLLAVLLVDWAPAKLAVIVLAAGAAMVDVAGVIVVLSEAISNRADGWQHAAALASAAVVFGLPVVMRRGRLPATVESGCSFATTGLLVGAGISISAGLTSGTTTLAAASVILVAAVALLALLRLPQETRVGATTALVTGVCSAALLTTAAVGQSLLLPLRWLDHAWSLSPDAIAIDHLPDAPTRAAALDWSGVIVLVATAVAIVLGTARFGTQPLLPARHRAAAIVPLVAVVAMAPLVAGWTIGGVVAIQVAVVCGTTAVAVLLPRSMREGWQLPLLAGAGAVLLPALGWALAARSTTVVALALLVAVGSVVTVRAESGPLRTALAGLTAVAVIAESAAVSAWASGNVETASVVVTATSGVVLLAGGLVPKLRTIALSDVLQWTGAAGMTVGLLLVRPGTTAFAVAGTVATAALALAVLGQHRPVFETAALLTGLGTAWAWLAANDVKTVEAYTIPAAALALGAGVVALRRRPSTTSWVLAPGLVIGFVPTLAIVRAESDPWRAAGLAVVALVALVAGARSRLQAPITIASITLIWLGLDAVWPTVAAAPRWVTLGLAGVISLWLGATAEHRMRQLHEFEDYFRHLH